MTRGRLPCSSVRTAASRLSHLTCQLRRQGLRSAMPRMPSVPKSFPIVPISPIRYQIRSCSWRRFEAPCPQVLVCLAGDAAAPGGAGQEAQLHQIGLVDVLQGDGLLADGGGQGIQPHGAAAVVVDDGSGASAGPPGPGPAGRSPGRSRAWSAISRVMTPSPLHLGEVPHPAAASGWRCGACPGSGGRSPWPASGSMGTSRMPGAAGDDQGQLLRGVQLQPQRARRSGPAGGRTAARPGWWPR